jgi:ketosteroid isomerase-like protein
LTTAMTDPVELVLEYIAATQRARSSQAHADFEAIRCFVAEDVEIRLASPWTDKPWRTAHLGADAMIDRLREGVQAASDLTTETINAVPAGDDVLVEQVSTLHTDEGDKVSCVAHLFTVVDGRITGIRAYRNDAGLPAG